MQVETQMPQMKVRMPWMLARMQQLIQPLVRQLTQPPVWQLIQPPRTMCQPLSKMTKEIVPQMVDSQVPWKRRVTRLLQMSLPSPGTPKQLKPQTAANALRVVWPCLKMSGVNVPTK